MFGWEEKWVDRKCSLYKITLIPLLHNIRNNFLTIIKKKPYYRLKLKEQHLIKINASLIFLLYYINTLLIFLEMLSKKSRGESRQEPPPLIKKEKNKKQKLEATVWLNVEKKKAKNKKQNKTRKT